MVEPLDSKNLVNLIANGRLSEFCLLCLIPLEDNNSESIFTLVCKEDDEYCIADALNAVCQFELHGTGNYYVCTECFKSASEAYRFHLQAKRSMELITHYTQELLDNVNNIEITGEDVEKLLFVPLSEYTPTTNKFNFNYEGIGRMAHFTNINEQPQHVVDKTEEKYTKIVENAVDSDHFEDIITDHNVNNFESIPDGDSVVIDSTADSNNFVEAEDAKNLEDNIIIVVEKEGSQVDDDDLQSSDDELVMIVNEKKVRKKRDPMAYMSCSQCPIKYRFVSKLKEHMKTVHNIDLFYCKICKILTEHKEEYEEHLKMHTDKHQCTICNMVYKKADTLVAHMRTHEKGKQFEEVENANICEQCGLLLPDEAQLEAHMRHAHVKGYTCFYCGRMYRGEASFEAHIAKHDQYWDKKNGQKPDQTSKQANKLDKSKRSVCQTCGKDFVDERSLLWHQRLHNNDRPYSCDVCGRGFVSKNRRNQHALCAHTPPQRRCPLCPALFHLRSMVNTHVKKVHLKAHKRRNRSSKHQNVFWRTRPVPIQELSIDVQNDVLELKAAQEEKLPEPDKENPGMSLFV